MKNILVITAIEADKDKIVTLDATISVSDTQSLYAKLTGDGGFRFSGEDGQNVTISNNESSYTGVTEVRGINFTVTAASNNIFGNTSGLYVDIGATVDFNSNLQTVGDLSGNGTIILGDLTVDIEKTGTTKDSTFDGTLDGAGSLTKDGNGVLILSGANTYYGATNINTGTLALTGSGRINDASSATVNGRFDVSGVTGIDVPVVNDLQGIGTVNIADLSVAVYKGDFNGVIEGRNGQLIKMGNDTDILTLSNVHTYTGATNIEGGTLRLKDAGSIASSSFVYVTGTFDISNVTDKANVKELTGNGYVNLGDKKLEVEQGIFGGIISDNSGTLSKTGTETFTLSGVNTYSGATNINAGTMILLLVFIPVSGSGKNCFSILSLRTVIRIMNIGT